jgi:tRNA (guanine10-N2)-methyltransferase
LQIADGQRDKISKLSLKRRKFIGNTSMDPQLSLYMANQALVKNGDLVLDPFVGTGRFRF